MDQAVGQQMWEQTLAYLKSVVDEESFSTWLHPTSFHHMSNNVITIAVPSGFTRNWLLSNFRDRIVSALRDVAMEDVDVQFLVQAPTAGETQYPADMPVSAEARGEGVASTASLPSESDFPRASRLNPRYTFDQFVVGESNRFAHAACRQVADPSSKSYNPLFIYGGVGLGKTHLMHAIGRQVMDVNNKLRVLYCTSEQFMNSFVSSIEKGKQSGFRDYYRNVDVLMIDDVQFFMGKERTQTEFFHTFNALYDAGKKIVVSSDRPPKELNKLEDRLRTRFAWGLVVDIQPPDLETRIAILKKKWSKIDETELPNEITLYVAERVQSNIRELEGVLVRLKAYCSLHGQPVTLATTREVLANLLSPEKPKVVDIEEIMECVCNNFDLRRSDLIGTSRLKRFSTPRHIAQYLARKLTTLSYPEIAARFGGRDHTSVLHAYRKIDGEIKRDENLANLVAYLSRRLGGPDRPTQD